MEFTLQGLPYLNVQDASMNLINILMYIPEGYPDWSDSLAQMLMITPVVHVIFY